MDVDGYWQRMDLLYHKQLVTLDSNAQSLGAFGSPSHGRENWPHK